jgi:hypothetical protein
MASANGTTYGVEMLHFRWIWGAPPKTTENLYLFVREFPPDRSD